VIRTLSPLSLPSSQRVHRSNAHKPKTSPSNLARSLHPLLTPAPPPPLAALCLAHIQPPAGGPFFPFGASFTMIYHGRSLHRRLLFSLIRMALGRFVGFSFQYLHNTDRFPPFEDGGAFSFPPDVFRSGCASKSATFTRLSRLSRLKWPRLQQRFAFPPAGSEGDPWSDGRLHYLFPLRFIQFRVLRFPGTEVGRDPIPFLPYSCPRTGLRTR